MSDDEDPFVQGIARKADRKLTAQRDKTPIVGLGFSMFGAVGWSVALPTILGALAGAWWDRHRPGTRSYTLILLVAGLVLGCANAWRWVAKTGTTIGNSPPGPHE
jgi:ATP synthase protein I